MAKFIEGDRLLPAELLDRFKYEVAGELGLVPEVRDGYWGGLPARDCGRVGGRIGGRMVRVMIRHMEESISQNGRD